MGKIESNESREAVAPFSQGGGSYCGSNSNPKIPSQNFAAKILLACISPTQIKKDCKSYGEMGQ